MSVEVFCCSDTNCLFTPGAHDIRKLHDFVKWAKATKPAKINLNDPFETKSCHAPFSIQLIRQSPFHSKQTFRFFVPIKHGNFEEFPIGVIENAFQRVENLGTLQCARHNQYYYIDLFEPKQGNTHSRGSNIARSLGKSAFTQAAHALSHVHSGYATSSTATESRHSFFRPPSPRSSSSGPWMAIYQSSDFNNGGFSSDTCNGSNQDYAPYDPAETQTQATDSNDSNISNDSDDQTIPNQGEIGDTVYIVDETEGTAFNPSDNLHFEDPVFDGPEDYCNDYGTCDFGDSSIDNCGSDDWS